MVISPILAFRQHVIDLHWEARVINQQHRREQAERRSFHKAPDDSDWDSK
jgi:hypothetical protein